jgi:HK97 family phage portal protein
MNLLQSLRKFFSGKIDRRILRSFAPPWRNTAGWWGSISTEQVNHFNSWVYAAVNAIAQEIAQQHPHVLRTTSTNKVNDPLPVTHPFAALLDNPNPWMTRWSLWYLTSVYLELTGNCFWYLSSTAGRPSEIWVIPSQWVRVITDTRQLIRGYEVQAPGASAEIFDDSEIMHLMYPNPMDPFWGLSPLQAAATSVDANTELNQARYDQFANGFRPGIQLTTEQQLSDVTVERLETQITTKHGSRKNWQRPMVLEQGLRASPWTLSPAEMDYLNSSKISRDEILAIYRVPAVMLGIVENVGLGGDIWFGAKMLFCSGTIQPKLELIGQAIAKHLGPRFGNSLDVKFPKCSPTDEAARRADDELDERTGIRSVNEIRKARNLEPWPEPEYDRPRPVNTPRKQGRPNEGKTPPQNPQPD